MKSFCSRSLIITKSLLVAMVLLCFAPELNAQMGMATLGGTVTDPSGAGVPGVQVTLQGELQKTQRQTATDSAGLYVIPAIAPGAYQLIFKAQGFEIRTFTQIILTSGQGSTLDVQLAVAKSVTQVSVQAASPLLQTTTASVGAEVAPHQFTALPTLGRNFTTLLSILPGVAVVPSFVSVFAASGVNGGGVEPSVYGQRQRDNNFTLDGVPDLEPDYGRVGMFPPPEAIAEMKVEASMDAGAYGWGPGANVNVVTKSGTNRYHGDAWEFIRNDALNARSFFLPSVGAFKWNQFGFAGGGPVWIPHILSKERAWYVFGYYEGIRHHQADNYTALVPTVDELAGNFSADAPIYNPYTSIVDASGSIVSRQQFGGNQIPTSLMDPAAIGVASALYPSPNLAAGTIPGKNFLNTTPLIDRSDQWNVRVDHQFGSSDSFNARYTDWNNPVTSFRLPALPRTGVNRYTNIEASNTHSFSPSLLVTGRFGLHREVNNSVTRGPDVVKQFSLQDVFPDFHGTSILRPLNIAGYTGLNQFAAIDGPQYFLTWTGDAQKIMGRNTLGFGGGFIRTSFLVDCTFGFEDFGPAQTALGPNTGNSMASFLLGLPQDAYRQGGSSAGDFRFHNWSFYVQDTLRATKKLTVNAGMRWDYISPPNDLLGIGSFDWNSGRYFWDHTNPITHAAPNIMQGMVPADYRGYQPRLGIAYQLTPRTVIRSAFGIFDGLYGANQQDPGGSIGNWPFGFPQVVTGLNTGVPDAFFANPFPGPLVGSPTPAGCNYCQNADVGSSRTPYAEEWSLSLQRQLTPSLMVELAYLGSHGLKLDSFIVDNTATLPGTGPLTDRQRWPQFPPYLLNGYREFMSWYDGFSLKVEKRQSKNLSLLLSYTWSKALDQTDDLSSGNIFGQPTITPTRFNIGQFKGPAGFDITQMLSASFTYQIPVKTGNRLADAVISNWELSGIIRVDTGVPYYVVLSTDNENIGTVGPSSEFPNLACNPTAFKPTPDEWFNTNCYQLPAFGTAGNAGKHALYSDGLANWDSAMVKRWPFGDARDVEFRTEFFNLLNGHTFDPPQTLYGTSGFGTVSNTTRGPGRNIQFALKLHF